MAKDELNEKELENVVGGLTNTSTLSSAAASSSLSEVSAPTDSQSTFTQTLSNIEKKSSDTSASIVSNLK